MLITSIHCYGLELLNNLLLNNDIHSNGREWYRLRQSIIGILHLKTVHSYWLRQKEIAQEFAQTLLSYPLTGVSNDFLRHAFLYSLEGTRFF